VRAGAVVWCDASRGYSRLVRFRTLDGALAAAQCFPCRQQCLGVHIVAFAKGREFVGASYGRTRGGR
jgi:hypothetical protein